MKHWIILLVFVPLAVNAQRTNVATGQRIQIGTNFSNVVTGGGGGSGVTATDNFTRANANPISSPMSDGVSTWTTMSARWANLQILSNVATKDGSGLPTGAAKVSSPTFSANQTNIFTLGAGINSYVGVRGSSSGGYTLTPFNSTTLAMYRWDDNGATLTPVLLPNFWTVATMGTGSILKLTVVGTTLTGYLDGVSIGSNTDATYSTGQPWLALQTSVTVTLLTASSP